MKDLSLLTWMTQLGLTVALPLGGFIWLAVWLRDRFGLGSWVLWLGIALGIIFALSGLRSSLKTLARFTGSKKKEPPAVSFNEHD
jgi:hypothetical protein